MIPNMSTRGPMVRQGCTQVVDSPKYSKCAGGNGRTTKEALSSAIVLTEGEGYTISSDSGPGGDAAKASGIKSCCA